MLSLDYVHFLRAMLLSVLIPQSVTSTASSTDELGRKGQRRWGNESGCYVSRCLWPATDSVRLGQLLGLDNTILSLVIGFITGNCEIRQGFVTDPIRPIVGHVAMRRNWRSPLTPL